MLVYRSELDDDPALLETPADTGSKETTRSPASHPVPRVDPVQFPMPGSYSMDGMTAILPGLFPAPELRPLHDGTPSAAGQHQVSKTDKPSSKAR